MYTVLRMDADSFERYRLKAREYRDKFVAHLDLDLTAYIPHLDPAWASVRFYHAHVIKEARPEIFAGLPLDIDEYQTRKSTEAAGIYAT